MMKKGTVLDKHFVLSEKIGQGQFAEVYAASNVKNQRQIVCYNFTMVLAQRVFHIKGNIAVFF
jgi:hypothetical protein